LAGLVRSTAMPTSVVHTKATAVTVRARSSPLIGPRIARATDAAALSSPMARVPATRYRQGRYGLQPTGVIDFVLASQRALRPCW
jgi:hypothetical protein